MEEVPVADLTHRHLHRACTVLHAYPSLWATGVGRSYSAQRLKPIDLFSGRRRREISQGVSHALSVVFRNSSASPVSPLANRTRLTPKLGHSRHGPLRGAASRGYVFSVFLGAHVRAALSAHLP